MFNICGDMAVDNWGYGGFMGGEEGLIFMICMLQSMVTVRQSNVKNRIPKKIDTNLIFQTYVVFLAVCQKFCGKQSLFLTSQ